MEQIKPDQPSGYALGHGEDELDRIINVARYLGDLRSLFLCSRVCP